MKAWGAYDEEEDDSKSPVVVELKRNSDDGHDKDSNNAQKCSYCLCDIHECLVRCKVTGRWFCNGKGGGTHSHIIHHLVKSHQTAIMLHELNTYRGTQLVCYSCHIENVFRLAFVQSMADGRYYVLCEKCMYHGQNRELKLDTKNRFNIVTDELEILDWLVRPPTEEEERRFLSPVRGEDMNLLEDAWCEKKRVTIRDIAVLKRNRQLRPVKKYYSSEHEYREIMTGMVEEERREAKLRRESLELMDCEVTWINPDGTRWMVSFETTMRHIDETEVGDPVRLKSSEHEFTGYISKIGPRMSMTVTIRSNCFTCPSASIRFAISWLFDGSSFDRQQHALDLFADDRSSVIPLIRQIWLGQIPETMDCDKIDNVTPDFPGYRVPLNQSQHNSLVKSLERKFTLIQGPPGTGKTTTIAAYVCKALQHCSRKKILVCCPSNVATEHVTHYISQTGVNVVRVVARAKDDATSIVSSYTLGNLVFQKSPMLRELRDRCEGPDVPAHVFKEYNDLRAAIECEICNDADVICCTASTSGNRLLSKMKFARVIIDEAGQDVEPSLLVPITHGCRQLVLVGDHQQLGPTVLARNATKAGYQTSILQRLVRLGVCPVRLTVQYRMHPALSEFPSNFFYEGALINGLSVLQRTPSRAVFRWPRSDVPMFFYNAVNGEEEQEKYEKSYYNRTEAALVIEVVTMLRAAGVIGPGKIGVITPYNSQQFYIKRKFTEMGLPIDEIDVESVDAFQGAERDYIVMSCVRSNSSNHVGFLADHRRGCVAITRARMGMIMIGHAETLAVDSMWYALIKHFQTRGLLVEGALENLRESAVLLESKTERTRATGHRK